MYYKYITTQGTFHVICMANIVQFWANCGHWQTESRTLDLSNQILNDAVFKDFK